MPTALLGRRWAFCPQNISGLHWQFCSCLSAKLMSPRGWATGMSRKEFLDKRGPEYWKSCKNGSKSSFFTKLCHDYFEWYHWSLPDNIEPVEGATYEEPTTPDKIQQMGSQIKAKKEVHLSIFYGNHI
jgi:hypothetical protein